jgi:hypothetical protein
MKIGTGIYKEPLYDSVVVTCATGEPTVNTITVDTDKRWFIHALGITCDITVDYAKFDSNDIGLTATATLDEIFGEDLPADNSIQVACVTNDGESEVTLTVTLKGYKVAK